MANYTEIIKIIIPNLSITDNYVSHITLHNPTDLTATIDRSEINFTAAASTQRILIALTKDILLPALVLEIITENLSVDIMSPNRYSYISRLLTPIPANLSPALIPTFGNPTPTTGGFTVSVLNYILNRNNSNYKWAVTATAGQVSINNLGVITVTGLVTGRSSVVTVKTSRVDYVSGSANIEGSSMKDALNPAFGDKTPTDEGFTAVIINYNGTYTWNGTATAGGAVLITDNNDGATGLVTVTNVPKGTSSTATITTTRDGYFGGTKDVTETSVKGTALIPEFGSTTAKYDGFTVVIINYDPSTYYSWTGTSSVVGGSVAVTRSGSTGLVTVTGVTPETDSTATISTTRTGYETGEATTEVVKSLKALLPALNPEFGTRVATTNGFTAVIMNYDGNFDWSGIATAGGSVVITNTGSGTGLVTVTNVAPGTESTAKIKTKRSLYNEGEADVKYTSVVGAALNPEFGTPVATANGFTVQIRNYNGNFGWGGTSSVGGSVAVTGSGSTGLVTVTGVAANTPSTATITTTQTGYAGGTKTTTSVTSLAALLPGLNPDIGSPAITNNGFKVQVNNYVSNNVFYSWSISVSQGSVSINASTGLVTATGLSQNTDVTLSIRTTRAGYSDRTLNTTIRTANKQDIIIQMAEVDTPGNLASSFSAFINFGSVLYPYKIGKYEVTGSQYTAFLNAMADADSFGLYNESMKASDTKGAQIIRSNDFPNYTYGVVNGERPITWVSAFDCARFCNWMSNGQPIGFQGLLTTEDGAYRLNGATYPNFTQLPPLNSINPNTGSAPTFRMPTSSEWYKAGFFYVPDTSSRGEYYSFATQSNTVPGTTIGSSANQANYNTSSTTTVGSFTNSPSFYGTFDQTGNVSEIMMDAITNGWLYSSAGGAFDTTVASSLSNRTWMSVSSESSNVGFRVVSQATFPRAGCFKTWPKIFESVSNGETPQGGSANTCVITSYRLGTNGIYASAGTITAASTLTVKIKHLLSYPPSQFNTPNDYREFSLWTKNTSMSETLNTTQDSRLTIKDKILIAKPFGEYGGEYYISGFNNGYYAISCSPPS